MPQLQIPALAIDAGAQFNQNRTARFVLWRIWDKSLPLVMFVGLNPSRANEADDDNTIRRVTGFAKSWGYGGFYMTNCFAHIATNPINLVVEPKTVAENDYWLQKIATLCRHVIFAWGAHKAVKQHNRHVELTTMFPNAKCLKMNKDGSPIHPLYVPKKTKPKFGTI